MRPIITILFLFISFFSRSQSQIGGRIGTGFTNLENIDEKSTTYAWRQGIYGGLIFTYRLNPALLLQPEINFSSEGGNRKEIQQVPVDSYTIPGTTTEQPIYAGLKTATIIHYLEMPVLAKVTADIGKSAKYYMCFGPYVSILLEAKRKAMGYSLVYLDEAGKQTLKQNTPPHLDVSSNFNYETNIRDQIKKANFGFIGASGFEYSLGPGAFFAECRVKLGMTNIYAYQSADGKHQTTSIFLTAGYLINIK